MTFVSRSIFLVCFVLAFVFYVLPFDRMDYISVVILIIGFILVCLGYFLTRDIASPQIILSVTWTISLFLTSLDVNYAPHIAHFNTKLEINTWFFIALSIFTFYICCSLAMLPITKVNRQKVSIENLLLQSKIIPKICYVSFLLAFAVYVFAIVKNGGIPAFSSNVNEDRLSFIPGTLGVFLTLFQLVVVLSVVHTLLHGFKKSFVLILLALASLIFSLLTTQRIAAIESILMGGIFFIMLLPFLPQQQIDRLKKPLILTAVSVLGFFIWGFVLIGQTRGLDFLQMTDLDNLVLEQFFIYFGGPAPRNLQMIMEGGIYESANNVQSGALFFRPILWFLGFRDDVLLNDTFRGPNNATALFQYYEDIGYWGGVIFPAFWGIVCGYIYGLFQRQPSIRKGVSYVIVATCIYFFPLTERFSEPATMVKFVLFILVISICSFLKLNIFIKKRGKLGE